LLNGSRAMSFVAGPSAGGLLVQLLNAPVAILADAISYLCSAFFLSRVHPVEPPGATGAGWGIGEGLRYIARSPVLRAILAATTTLNLFNYVYAALFVLYATRSLGVSPGALGLVLGAASVGALLAASVTKPLVRRLGIGRAYVLSQLAFPAPLLLVPLASGGTVTILALLFVAEFLSGAGVMVLDITAGSLMTAATPDELRARTAGAQRTINYGIRPVGALMGGFLGATIGVHAALWVGAVGGILGVLWLLGSPVPRMSEI
jgi:Na+/melibiose symporter-like transporter